VRHSPSSLLVVIMVTAVIAAIAVQPGRRSCSLSFHSIPRLAGAQMALFLLQELVEHLRDAEHPVSRRGPPIS
jgi:hypothetical protein